MNTKTASFIVGATLLIGGGIAVGGAPVSTFQSVDEIKTAQDAYFAKTGKYLQVKPGDKVKTLLGKELPNGTEVDEYISSKGAGFQIRWEDENGWYSKGYGPEATERTWSNPKPMLIASST